MITDLFWAIVIIAGSVGFGLVLEWFILAYRHRNEHYEENYPRGGAQ